MKTMIINGKPITMKEVKAELYRELTTRKKVYPGWIRNGKLYQHQADHRIACLEYLLEWIKESEEKQSNQMKLF